MTNKHRGFTLLEILIALFIFTIVALIMTRTLHSVLSTQAATEKAAEQLRQTQMALLLLSRDLEQAIDRPTLDQEGRTEAAFSGTRTTLSFVHGGLANLNGTSQTSSLQRSGYRLEKNQLVRDTWDQLDQAPHARPHSRPLLDGIQALTFRYLDNKKTFHVFWATESDGADAPGLAQANNPIAAALALSHANEEKLPRAVQLDLTFTNGNHLQQLYLLPQQEVPHNAR